MLNVNSNIEISGTHLVAETITVANSNADIQCEQAIKWFQFQLTQYPELLMLKIVMSTRKP